MSSSSTTTTTAATGVLLHVLLITTTISSLILSSSSSSSTTKTFRVDFIHRDSPRSPFYNSSQTQYERTLAAVQRTIIRAKQDPTQSGSRTMAIPNNVDQLMSLSVGTPQFRIVAAADIGSDLIWTQCKPCDKCYPMSSPVFDPSASSSYRNLSCGSGPCSKLFAECGPQRECKYNYGYRDDSSTTVILSSETVTFINNIGVPVSVPNITIGCAHQTNGKFDPKETGIIGLGRGPLSLISQLGDSIGKQFSYCLVSISQSNSSSTFVFGPITSAFDSAAVSTPLLQQKDPTYYGLKLDYLQVGNKQVPFPSTPGLPESNIFIDSGTTFTTLPQAILLNLVDAITGVVDLVRIRNHGTQFDLCYYSGSSRSPFDGLPDIKFVFKSNATVTLPSSNMFVAVSNTTVCLAILAGDDPVYGNLAQMNFIIKYEVGRMLLTFIPHDCTQF